MSVMYPTWGSPKTIDQIRADASVTKLHPRMRERVLQLIVASNGAVGLGVGFRSEDEQRQLFLSRYVVDAHGPVQFDGKRWVTPTPPRPAVRCTSSGWPSTWPATMRGSWRTAHGSRSSTSPS
jgi:hypothetical protein